MRVKSLLFIIGMLGVFWTRAGNSFSIKTIVIDAGHGGKDPGATGPGKTNEKDVALAVALKLGAEIHKNFPGINIIYTRKTDVFVELHERADIANKNKADLFICIHCNSSPSASTYGTSTYVLGLHRTEANLEVAKRENAVILLEGDRDKNYEFDPNSPEGNIIMSMKQNAFLDQSIDFASKIENQFEFTAKRKSLGVKQAGFYVLYKTTMPSLLSEIGFVSNPEEEKFLKSNKGQELIANAIFKAFSDYKFEMENGQGEHPSGDVAAGSVKAAAGTDSAVVSGQSAGVRPPLPISAGTETTGGESEAGTGTPSGEMTTESGKKIRKPFENSGGGGITENAKDEKTAPPADTTNASQSANSGSTNSPAPVDEQKPKTPAPAQDVITVGPGQKMEVKVPLTEKPATTEDETETASIASRKTAVKAPVSKPKKPVAAEKSPAVKTVTASRSATDVNGIVYKVQLFALKGEPKKAENDKANNLFGGMTTENLPNGIIRYYAGEAKSLEAIHVTLKKATSNGYKDAFIVGFKDGRRFLPERPAQ